MGLTYGYECKICDYKFIANLGVGFRFPEVYQRTVEEMKAGVYGELGSIFFELYPEGAIEIYETAYRCKKCGDYKSLPRLSMYIPNEGYHHEPAKERWTVSYPWDGTDYISLGEIREHYTLLEEYDHRCTCGGEMESITKQGDLIDKEDMICPHCNIPLDCYWMEQWD